MTLTNYEIYTWASELLNLKFDEYLPVKVNFYFKKNKDALVKKAEEIEEAKKGILDNYSKRDENGNITFENDENEKKANEEFNNLLAIEQEVKITKIPLSSFKDINMKTSQLEVLMNMIDEDK